MGFLQQDNGNKYLLAPRAANPGLSVIASMRRALPAVTILEELRDSTGYTVSLGVMRHHSVTYVHRLFGHRQSQWEVDLELRAGAHIPLYCTALGKALLATFPDEWRQWLLQDINFVPCGPQSIVTRQELILELRELDIREPIISDEEFVVGARSIAMYVPRPNEKRPVGIEVTVPSRYLTVAQLQEQIGPAVVYAASLISQAPGASLTV
jgi:IclR family pca regulon transcriptional regulator